MRLTMPQIIMLNHAAWVNKERSDKRMERERADKDEPKKRTAQYAVEDKTNVKFEQMTSEEIAAYVVPTANFWKD